MVIKKFVVPLLELPMIGGGEVVEGLAHPVLLLRQVPAWGGAEERAPRRRRSPEPDSLGAAREEESRRGTTAMQAVISKLREEESSWAEEEETSTAAVGKPRGIGGEIGAMRERTLG